MWKWKQVDPSHTQQIKAELLGESQIDIPYLILIITSCAIATFGLLSNSTAVIIGAMVIAPLMLPIRSLAFGALIGDSVLFRRGIIAVAIGTFLAVLLSSTLGWLTGITSFGSEILARTQPTLLDLGIAVAAGGIGGYGKIEPKVSSTVAGTAIAVALMPPICVIGLGLSQGNWSLSLGATLLYLTNLLGIALACMLVFLLTGYAPLRQAGKPIMGVIALTSILLLPLGWRFAQLVEQARLESSLRKALVNKTITFQRLDLVDLKSNWLTNPPEVRLTVYAKDPVTPKQVELLEAFITRELSRPFKFIFMVNYVAEVKREENPMP
jgi:uncharacterized hydrophobic protein (TIGR00271 family)